MSPFEREFGRHIAVLIPEIVKRRWYQRLMHTHQAHHLRARLLAHGDEKLTVISVPWTLSGG